MGWLGCKSPSLDRSIWLPQPRSLDMLTWMPEMSSPDGLTWMLESRSLDGLTWPPEPISLDGFTWPQKPSSLEGLTWLPEQTCLDELTRPSVIVLRVYIRVHPFTPIFKKHFGNQWNDLMEYDGHSRYQIILDTPILTRRYRFFFTFGE